MFLKNLPQGWLPGVEASRRLARSKYSNTPIGRLEEEELWRELCEHTFKGRVSVVIFTGNGATADADRGQFVALGSRYIFQVDTLSSWLESEQCHIEIEMQPDCEFLDKHGRVVCGQLLFRESDLEAVCAADRQAEESHLRLRGREPTSKKKPSLNDQKHAAVLGAFEALGRENLSKLLQKERESRVIAKVAAEHNNLSVTDRYVRELWKTR